MALEKDKDHELPPPWRGLIGYDGTKADWHALVASKRLPQVMLLTGRPGLGKRSLLALLTALHVCKDATACGGCVGCEWLLAGQHPEVLWLEAVKGGLRIDAAEKLQEHLALSPSGGASHRLAVIVDADQLNQHAANRLLKTLEEPPPRAQIFLSTSRLGALLPTIRSRCVQWRVLPPSLAESAPWLVQQLTQDGRGPSLALCTEELRRCGLSPGAALQALAKPDRGVDLSGLLSAASTTQVLQYAEQLAWRSGLPVAQLLREWEIALNQLYRQALTGGARTKQGPLGVAAVAARRALLSEAKRLVIGHMVTLNAQLLTEALAVAQQP